MVEIGFDEGETNDSLADALGGTFRPNKGELGLVRCGLFYHSDSEGNSSDSGAKNFPVSPPDQKWHATVGDIFASNGYGTITTGRYLGTHKIIDAPDPFTYVLEDDKVSSYRDDVSRRLPNSASEEYPINSPHNVSRGTAHQPMPLQFNPDDPLSCGFYRMWFHITAETVEVSEFTTPLGKGVKVHPYSCLLYTSDAADEV